MVVSRGERRARRRRARHAAAAHRGVVRARRLPPRLVLDISHHMLYLCQVKFAIKALFNCINFYLSFIFRVPFASIHFDFIFHDSTTLT